MDSHALWNILDNFRQKLQNPKSLFGSSFNLILGQGVGFLTLFFLDIWFIRVFNRTDFGTWKQFIWLVRFIVPFLYFGLPDSYRYFSAIDKHNYKFHFFSILALLIVIYLILQILYFTGALDIVVLLTKNEKFNSILIYFPLLVLLSSLKFINRINAIFLQKTNTIILANILFSFFFVLIIVIGLRLNTPFLILILLSWLVAEFIRLIYYFIANRLKISFPFWKRKFSITWVLKYFKYGIPYYLSTTIFLFFLNVDKTIVSVFAGVESFAVFSIAAVEIPFLPSVFTSVAQNLFPRLAEIWPNNPSDAFKLWFKAFQKVSYLIFPIVIVLLLISRPIFVFAYTEKYVAGLAVFRIYLLLSIWRTASYTILLNASGNPKQSLKFNGAFLFLNVVLSYVLYKFFGVIGIVWGTFFSFSLLNLTILLSLKRLKQFIELVYSDKKLIILLLTIVVSFSLSNLYF